jgi:hypothetical protein
MTGIVDDLRQQVSAEATRYSPAHERPLGGYVRVIGAYSAVVGALSAAVVLRKRNVPVRPAVADLVLVAAATAKLSRLLARDAVTAPLRAPFTTLEHEGHRGDLTERVRGQGLRRSLGELVTCPFCLSQWIATGFTFGLLLAPGTTRQVAGTFTALELADLLQYARAAAENASRS